MRILVIGHVDHGKTTFICALNNYLYTRYGIGSADRACPTTTENNCVTCQESVSYSLNDVNYTFFDCPGYADYLNMFEKGEEKYDAALLLCAACDGPMPQTIDLFKKSMEYGIDKYVVFMTKTDIAEDPELIELTTEAVLGIIDENGFHDEVPVVTGSALKALENPESQDANCIPAIMQAVQKVCTQ